MFLLMILELFMLKNYFLRMYICTKIFISNYFIFVFVVLRVAEARVGLSLLTSLVRAHGTDYIGVERI